MITLNLVAINAWIDQLSTTGKVIIPGDAIAQFNIILTGLEIQFDMNSQSWSINRFGNYVPSGNVTEFVRIS